MPKNKPSEETLAQARRVIDALNDRGARKQAIRLKVSHPMRRCRRLLPSLVAAPTCPPGSLRRPMRKVSRWA